MHNRLFPRCLGQFEAFRHPCHMISPIFSFHDSGYLWRLNSYWRFKQVDEGVIVECESLSLSRGIPTAMKWFVDPFTRSIPKQTLKATLESIRTGLTKP